MKITNTLFVITAALALHNPAAHAVVFTTNTAIGTGNTTYDNQEIIVSGCTLTVDGPHAFASLVLTNGAVLTHSPAPNGETNNRVDLTIAGDAEVPAGCSIDVSGHGYASASGPGAGCSSGGESGGGGGHGGVGGVSAKGCPGGGAYNSILTPTLHGSGGGNGYASPGGYGGGVIRLTVGGTLRVDGAIAANGGSYISGNYGGGGAGGSVSLTVDTMAGTGAISVNGGNGSSVGGGGGGGRIAVEFTALASPPATTAFGGNGYQRGGAGTVLIRPFRAQTPNLDVWNNNIAGAVTPLSIAGGVHNLVIRQGAVAVPDGTLLVTNLVVSVNGTLTCLAGQTGVVATALNAFSIEAGGQVTADGLGWPGGTGPGAGGRNDGDGGGGGSHGGSGGQGAGGARGGNTYDQIPTPHQWGSGGGGGYQSTPGAGGGCVRLVVGGALRVDGSLTANGAASTRPGLGSYAGGGSGGSLWLTAGSLTGTGTISANGGAGTSGGGGGGGRISVSFNTNSFVGGLTAIGASGYQRGGAGTVFTLTNGSARGQVRVDNSGNLGAPTILNATLCPAEAAFDVTATGAALVYPQGPLTLASLRVNGDAVLSHGAGEKTFNLTITSNVVIETNGQINVAGLGYPIGIGPGAGWYAYNGNAGGGGHGGGGGGAQIPYSYQGGGGTYDSPTQPVDFGSGGGGQYGGAGGGAIRLNINGTLQLDGHINAFGAGAPDSHYGGGAGGSIWLQLGTLAGSGSINAAGGWSGGPGGGGGGGRVAIYVRSINSFDTNRITVAGGWGGTYGGPGLDGTLRLLPLSQAAPQLTITCGSGQALLSWPSFSGLQYQLLSATNLPAANWLNEGVPIPGTGGSLSTNLPIGPEPRKFFRLLIDN